MNNCFPDWFQNVPGFMFLDGDEERVMVVGEGQTDRPGFHGVTVHDPDKNYDRVFVAVEYIKSRCLAIQYRNDGRVYFIDLMHSEFDAEYWEKCEPLSSEESKHT